MDVFGNIKFAVYLGSPHRRPLRHSAWWCCWLQPPPHWWKHSRLSSEMCLQFGLGNRNIQTHPLLECPLKSNTKTSKKWSSSLQTLQIPNTEIWYFCDVCTCTYRKYTTEKLPVKNAWSPFLNTSEQTFLSVACLFTYPSNSRKASPLTILPTNSPGSPKTAIEFEKKSYLSRVTIYVNMCWYP